MPDGGPGSGNVDQALRSKRADSIPSLVRTQRTQGEVIEADGGPGSGNFGHSGRPGLRGGSAASSFNKEAYTPERKQKAIRAQTYEEYDNAFRDKTGEVWQGATDGQKKAITEYTGYWYTEINGDLRNQSFQQKKTTAELSERIENMTTLIDKCSYDEDIMLVRGIEMSAGSAAFLKVPLDKLKKGSESELRDALVGSVLTEYGFSSACSKTGTSDWGNISMNIYCPKGTKMMYAEPFSENGMGNVKWDGKSKQSMFGSEFETIIQRGTRYRCTGVRVTGMNKYTGANKLELDIEVIYQNPD